VSAGADPNIHCLQTTPLYLACFHGQIALAEILLGYGANVNVMSHGAHCLHVAVAKGLVALAQLLVRSSDLLPVNVMCVCTHVRACVRACMRA
jgi:ankyrin repeat protein